MKSKIISGLILLCIGGGLFFFSNNMQLQVEIMQQKLNTTENNNSVPPALAERPLNRLRQESYQQESNQAIMIGQRTLDEQLQLIQMMQIASGICLISGAVLLTLAATGKKRS